MKCNIVLTFYENADKINFNAIPDSIQKDILESFTTSKFKKYLEKNISDMGSVCKNKVSHYLKFKINKIKPSISKSLFGFFGSNSVNLDIDATISEIKKKSSKRTMVRKKIEREGNKRII